MSELATGESIVPGHCAAQLLTLVNTKLTHQPLIQACLEATRRVATETDDRSVLLFFAMLALGRHPKGTSAKSDFVALYAELGLEECSRVVSNCNYCASDLAFFWSSHQDFSNLFENSEQEPVKTYQTCEHPRPLPKSIMSDEWGDYPFHEFDLYPDPLPPKYWNLYQIDDATIIYDTTECVVLDSTGRPINELCSRDYQHVFFTKKFGDSLEQIRGIATMEKPKEAQFDAAVMIQDPVPNPNYCHWLLDQLPRTRNIQQSHYLILQRLAPFIQESLDLMDIANERVVELIVHPFVTVKQLTIDSSTAKHWLHPLQLVNSELVNHVRSSLQPDETSAEEENSKRNIYISRNRSGRRHISNEDELLLCLERFDFDVVYLEELSITQQISIFKKASVVVAPHGAGLSNVLFCENASVIEIFNPNYGTESFRYLSILLGLRYQHIMGKNPVLSTSERQRIGRAQLQKENIAADIELLEQCLKKILLAT